ncbi:NUDIX hydrolase [Virgibacillus xinjiangensis]|uniref:NUDIX hydrolase n=1 Tax=Virgibacillus xinjiangensis TaxID=393090 RepID=A0ABV7CY19_9BACI
MDASSIINKLKDRTPAILGQNNYFRSAILIPLVEKDGETHLLFEVRSMKLHRQPGDTCFPGGRIEQDDQSPCAAAIRETTEELTVKKQQVEEVIPLDYVVSDSGRIIYPFVGSIRTMEEIQPNDGEVEEVFTVPLSFFLENEPDIHQVRLHVEPGDDFPYELIVGGENYNWQFRKIDELFYQYDGKVIWGLTAKILRHFVDLLKS